MKFHLVGIGGTGMSALAEVLLDNGGTVSGSDRSADDGTSPSVLNTLRNEGVELFPQDGSGVEAGPFAVVASSAVEDDNPDICTARACNISIIHRAKTLAGILSEKKVIAVAGTCGKSTTTAMLGHIFVTAGFHPSVVNGASVTGWKSDSRTGAVLKGIGDICIVEVDESDKSLFFFNPYAAIITNASADHFSVEETNEIFDKFKSGIPGPVIDGRIPTESEPIITEKGWRSEFKFRGVDVSVPIPGRHNAINAWMALRMAEAFGVAPAAAAAAIAEFRGVSRRMEYIGRTECGAAVFDDYAHNTEKIRAALSTVRSRSDRTVALWRPHGYGPLKKMMDELVKMFKATLRHDDRLFILPVFDAGGTADRTIRSNTLVNQLRSEGVHADYSPDISAAVRHISNLAKPGDTVIVMGARDPELPVAARVICTDSTPPPPFINGR